jgi:hypothetical protein
MKRHPHPVIPIYAQIAEIRDGVLAGGLPPAAVRDAGGKIKDEIRQMLAAGPGRGPPWTERAVCLAGLHGVQYVCSDEEWRFRELCDLWDFMLRRQLLDDFVIARIAQHMERFLQTKGVAREHTEAAAALCQRTISACTAAQPPPVTSMGEPTAWLLALMENTLRRFPQPEDRSPVRAWSGTQLLWERPTGRNIRWLLYPPLLRDGFAYVVTTLAGTNAGVQAFRVPLTGGEPEVLGQLRSDKPVSASGICLDDRNLYVSTYNTGVLILPLRGGAGHSLDLQAGLPSNRVAGVAILDGILYVGLGPPGHEDSASYLIACDRETMTCRVLASNARREKLTPFDDQGTFEIRDIVSDPPRKRIVFPAHVTLREPHRNDSELTGIWEYSVARQAFRKLLDYPFVPWCRRADDHRIIISTYFAAILFDLETDTARLLRLTQGEAQAPMLPIAPDAETIQTSYKSEWEACEALVGDSLWLGKPFARISRDGQAQALPAEQFGQVVSISWLGKTNRVFLAADRGLWLLDLAK